MIDNDMKHCVDHKGCWECTSHDINGRKHWCVYVAREEKTPEFDNGFSQQTTTSAADSSGALTKRKTINEPQTYTSERSMVR